MIDFSTLQGLTIPEGVVAEIKDASGRVIWEALEPIVYLRPSADISLGHPIYPDTLSSGYLAISEAVSDGSSTYIGYDSYNNDVSATSKFAMSLQGKHKISRVSSARFIFNGGIEGNSGDNTGSTTAQCSCSVSILGENVFSWSKTSSSARITSDTVDMPDFVSVLNNYIGANGTSDLPEVTIEIRNNIIRNNKAGTSYVSTIAIELECGR